MGYIKGLFEKGVLDSSVQVPYEEFLEMLMQGISDFTFLMKVEGDRTFKYMHMNPAAENHHKLGHSIWHDKRIEDFLGPEKAESLIDKYQQVVSTGEPVSFNDQMWIDGEYFTGHTLLTPIKDADQNVQFILAITRDITEVVKKEKDLGRINALYRSLMEHTADGIMIISTQGEVLEVNAALEKLYGFSKEELKSGNFPFVPKELEGEIKELIQRALIQENISGYETIRQHKDGRKLSVSITVSLIHDETGRVIGISSIVRDITKEKLDKKRLEVSHSRYRSLFTNSPQAILTLTLRGTITRVNRACLEMMNKEEGELLHTSLLSWVSRETLSDAHNHFQKGLTGEYAQFKTRFEVDGRERIIKVFLVPIVNHNKKEGLYALMEDITEKEQAEEAVRQSEEKFRLIADYSNDLISVFTPSDGMVYASPSHKEFLGFDPAEASNQQLSQVFSPGDFRRVLEVIERCYRTSEPFTFKVKVKSQSNQWVWFECKGTPVLDEHESVSHIVVVARDITEQKSYEERLKKYAFYDYLTNLPNRRLFEDRMERTIVDSRRTGSHFALLYLDGDGFKRINDQYGHDFGDEFLKLVGKRLEELTREGDSVGRIGGDEFAVLVNHLTSPAQARNIADRLLRNLREPYRLGELELKTSFSIGVAYFPDDGGRVDQLFRYADEALYAGKNKGKDQITLYQDIYQ